MFEQRTRSAKLFSPISIKTMELKNRIVMPPMGTMLAGPEGEPTDRLIDYYAARAEGGAALITVEVAHVHPYTHTATAEGAAAAIYDDRLIPDWKRLTDRIHATGAKASLQLHHPGRVMAPSDPSRPPLAPSATPAQRHPPRPLTIAEIEELAEAFGQGARRAREAGFDAVDIHGGHGYLIAQFMSAESNRRTDSYGGDLRGRLRFALDVLTSVRVRVGPDFPVIFRFSADERTPGGRTLDESVVIAPLLVDAGADCLSISTGTRANVATYTIPPMGLPGGLNTAAAAAIKAAVDVPVIVAGKLNDPLLAEEVVASGKSDLVAIGRGLIADPEWSNKVRDGRWEDIRPCISCNQGCLSNVAVGYAIKCLVNPEVGREREMELRAVSESKRVLVAGGGPAGMVAAGVAALRGHHVTLFERESSLGGQLRAATVPPMKQEISPYLKYLESQLYKAGVDVRCGQELTASAVLDERPDCVVVATGGRSLVPNIQGIDGDKVATAVDVLMGKSTTGRRVLVAGGGMVGCETAESLAEYGKRVTIVEMLPVLAGDMVVGPRQLLLDRLKERGVETVTSARVVEITADGAVVEHEGQRRTIGGMDTIVLAMGVTPVDELAAQVGDRVPELHVIGDAASPGQALEAIAAGAEVGRKI